MPTSANPAIGSAIRWVSAERWKSASMRPIVVRASHRGRGRVSTWWQAACNNGPQQRPLRHAPAAPPMCRLFAYFRRTDFLEDLVCKPEHSLVRQSMQAERRSSPPTAMALASAGTPALRNVRSRASIVVTPAWSDENLLALCAAVRSPLFLPTCEQPTGTSVARAELSPVPLPAWLFIHNGQIGDYAKIRRRMESLPAG